MNTALIEKIISTQEFASLPQVTMKVLSLLEDDYSLDVNELAKLIESDASLSIKLIHIANSPLFGIGIPIESVKQSIVTLGLNRVGSVVLAVSIYSKYLSSKNSVISKWLDKYLTHTASVAALSKSLSNRLSLDFKETDFIGGLLHDIGKLAMMQFDHELYTKVIDFIEQTTDVSDIDAENKIFGCDHCVIGAIIADR